MNDNIFKQEEKQQIDEFVDPLVDENYSPSTTLDVIGSDSTTTIDVQITAVDDEALNKNAEQWLAEFRSGEIKGKEALDMAMDVMEETVKEFNKTVNMFLRTTADAAISIGKMALAIKPIVKSEGLLWEKFVPKKMKFISLRNLQKYINLAKREDCHPFTFLGIDGLDFLCKETKDFKGEDKVRSFLEKYGIEFKEKGEYELSKIKLLIRAGCNCEFLKKHGINKDAYDFELVKHLTLSGTDFNLSLINELKKAESIKGDPRLLLKEISANNGKVPKYVTDDDPEKRVKDFNSLSSKIIITIDTLFTKYPEQVKAVDDEILSKVEQMIQALLKKKNQEKQDEAA